MLEADEREEIEGEEELDCLTFIIDELSSDWKDIKDDVINNTDNLFDQIEEEDSRMRSSRSILKRQKLLQIELFHLRL